METDAIQLRMRVAENIGPNMGYMKKQNTIAKPLSARVSLDINKAAKYILSYQFL